MLGGRADWDPFVATVAVPDLRTVRTIYRQMFGQVPLPLYLGQKYGLAPWVGDDCG